MPHCSAPQIASINTSITTSMTTTRTSLTHTLRDLVLTSFAMSRKLHSPVWIQRTLLVRQDATNLLLTSILVFKFHNSKTMNLDSTTKKSIQKKLPNSMRKLTLTTSKWTTTTLPRKTKRVGSRPKPYLCSITTFTNPAYMECNIISTPHPNIPLTVVFWIWICILSIRWRTNTQAQTLRTALNSATVS